MSKIDCLKIAKGKELEKSLVGITENMPESKQRELGLKAALAYHKQLHNELQDFKKSIAPDPKKYRKESYKAPDFSEQLKQIKDQSKDKGNRVIEPLPGAPVIKGATGADVNLVSAAESYAAENNIPLSRQSEYVEVDVELAKRIADAYEKMKNDPENPAVKEAYQNLINQTKAQYDTLVKNGYEFTFFDSESDPYEGNPYNAMRDLRNNKKMAVYGTYDGYGTEGITAKELSGSPMLADTGLKWKDQKGVEHIVTANDLFRAVHDAFGHGLEGSGFRARGEENAWQAHSRLFTGSAIGAMTSETRGQNSWLNYGKFGEKNRTAKVEDTVFAEQKIGLMPEWTWKEGRAGDMGNNADTKSSVKEELPKVEAPIQKQGVVINTSNASTIVSQEGDSDLKKKIISDAKKVLVALKGIAPNLKVIIHETDASMKEAIGGLSRGAFDRNTNTIHINIESVDRAIKASDNNKSNTVLHEGVHPILNIIAENNPEIIAKLNSQISSISEKVDGVKSIIAYGDSQGKIFGEAYGKMETVVEFISQVANGDIDIRGIEDAGVLARLSKVLNDFLKMLGVNKSVSINKADDIIKLSRQISNAFDSSATIGVMKVSGNETSSSKIVLQGEVRDDFKRTDNYKAIEQKPLSFFKDETITITGADWLAAGDLMMPDGSSVNLKGGWAYPAETGNVWATAGKGAASAIINKMNESIRDTGVAHLGIRAMTGESAISNYSTFIVAANYIQSALINKDITKKELVARVQSAYKNNSLSGKNSSISLATKSDKIVDALLYDFSVSASTFEERKAFLFSVLGGVNLKSKSVWGNLPTSGELLKKVTDPSLVGIRNQSLVAIVRVDSPLTSRQTTAAQDGRIYHDAYPVIIESTSTPKVFLLDGAYNIEDAVPNFIDNSTKNQVSASDYAGQPVFGVKSYTNKIAGGAAQVVRNVKTSETAKPAIQFQGEGDLVEQSGKRKEMTEDDNGNYLFFHYSDKKFDTLNPEKVGTHLATSRSEKTSVSTSSLYTRPDILEANVPNDFGSIVRVPKDNVYPFATDPLNLLPEAKAQFRENNKDIAFDANNQVASVAKLAAEKGFPVTVADWNIKGKKTLIAKTTEALSLEPYTNIKPGTTNQIQYAKGTENIKPNAKRRDLQLQGTGLTQDEQALINNSDYSEKFNEFINQANDKNKRVFPSIKDFAKSILPESLFKKYDWLYDIAGAVGIKVSPESFNRELASDGYGASYSAGFVNVDNNTFKQSDNWGEFQEIINHEIIHGLLNLGVRNDFNLNKDLSSVFARVLNEFDNAPDNIKNTLSYIVDTKNGRELKNLEELSDKEWNAYFNNGDSSNGVLDSKYITGDLEELLTYAFSNKDFADWLDKMPASKDFKAEGIKPTIFNQLKNILRGFLKKTLKGATVLDEINSIVDKYLDLYNPKMSLGKNSIGNYKSKPQLEAKIKALQNGMQLQGEGDTGKPLTGGAAFSDFFAKITNTKDGGAKFDDVKQVLNKGINGFENELAAYLKYGKNFQKHIMASIPAFVDARIRALKGMSEVAVMLGKGGKEVNMLDITSSEGYFTKAWAQLSQDKGVNAKADALDAGVTFQRDFNEAPQVKGVNYLLQAWGDSFVDPNSGVTIPSFKATKKYGVVFEGMGFQFFTSTRDKEIQEVKSMMDKGGLFVTMEKLKNSDYEKREVLKDEFKSQFFTQKEMAEKAATVLKKSDEASVGMMDYQFDRLEYEKVLSENFDHVVQFYSAGNFAGYYASDNLEVINTALKNTGDTTTKFNEEATPRVISKEGVQLQGEGVTADGTQQNNEVIADEIQHTYGNSLPQLKNTVSDFKYFPNMEKSDIAETKERLRRISDNLEVDKNGIVDVASIKSAISDVLVNPKAENIKAAEDVLKEELTKISDKKTIVESLGNKGIQYQYAPSEINDAVNEFRDSGLAEDQIKDLLQLNGNTDAEIDAALKATEPQAQSPTVQPGINTNTGLSNADHEAIKQVVSKEFNLKNYPTLLGGNDVITRLAAGTQERGQERELDFSDTQVASAHLGDLKAASIGSAQILKEKLGKDWKNKITTFFENEPATGFALQKIGLLNIISSEINQQLQKATGTKQVDELKSLQRRIDVVSMNVARQTSLALNSRRLYSEFAKEKPIADILSSFVLTSEQKDTKSAIEEAIATQHTDAQLNAPPRKTKKSNKNTTQTTSTTTTKETISKDVKDSIILQGAEASEQVDAASGNKIKMSLSDLLKSARESIKNFKC